MTQVFVVLFRQCSRFDHLLGREPELVLVNVDLGEEEFVLPSCELPKQLNCEEIIWKAAAFIQGMVGLEFGIERFCVYLRPIFEGGATVAICAASLTEKEVAAIPELSEQQGYVRVFRAPITNIVYDQLHDAASIGVIATALGFGLSTPGPAERSTIFY